MEEGSVYIEHCWKSHTEITKDITVSYTTRNAILSRKKQGKI